ncbi:MraY family glycosyltransferase [Pontibacillus marinus]|uniref:UDP-phosphate N-acetylglucosaminyl 1-phosphate transferase n=1 Tax=Pontibacillus marinus BH030004 = DSM 16465 TaxID=1385511 RepID=A0A0A5I6S5_9BACI|nr:MraY family glycosyltransferase [Pontibacillus marinus]KGX91512.1 UDP-phosphate N-acetylglucosaminyl 1-phosphate transferase [Pontibacillus marinus BH030004 = DSM 16465]
MNYVLTLIIPIIISLIITPFVRKLAFRLNIVDQPNSHRKVHQKVMPYLGGIAIYISFSLSYLIADHFTTFESTTIGNSILIGGLIIVITGSIDDAVDIRPIHKLVGQMIAALIPIYYGLSINVISLPFIEDGLYVGWFGIAITFIWIVGMTNAVNFIDGLDGLASGVSAISFGALFVVSLLLGNMMLAFTSILLIGALLGFLPYNFYPARIFMGDSGSLFLGYTLAVLSLLELKQVTLVSFLVPIIILGIPLMDTFYAMIRRKLKGVPISSPDKDHLHHRFLHLGFSHRTTVLIIYAISFVFSCFAVLVLYTNILLSLFVVGIVLVLVHLFAEFIGIFSDQFKPLTSFLFKFIRAMERQK